MIASETPSRVTSRSLSGCVLLLAMIVLPTGASFAQDYEAVEKRLGKAVVADEISLEQAAAMMGALRHVAEKQSDKNCDKGISVEEELKRVGDRIKAAAEAGKISEDEAWSKWVTAKTTIIKGAVKSGRISGEKARALWKEIEKVEARIKLGAAVEKGELTAEEAKAKWVAMYGDGKSNAETIGERIKAAGDRLKAAVESGDMTEKEAWAKWTELKNNSIAPRLKSAVKAEKITEDEAWAIWKSIEKAETEERGAKKAGCDAKKVDWDSIKKRIEGAVERGDITPEEADAKYKEIKKRLAESGK